MLSPLPRKKGRRSLEVMRAYFGTVLEVAEQPELSLLRTLSSFESRKKLLQLVASVSVHACRDVYLLFDRFVLSQFPLQGDWQVLCLFSDITGLLSAELPLEQRALMLELIIYKLREEAGQLEVFREDSLLKEDSQLQVLLAFLQAYF
jgi:hypothetical protein